MEVNLLMGSSGKIKEPILVSNSIHSLTNSKPGELVLAEQEADKCKHFTIRGFVSEVRKRNAKICWPFSMHDHTSDGHVHTLPPLPVKEFRRWGCGSCVPKTIALEAITENGANVTNTNDGEKRGSTLLLGDPPKASHCAPKASHCETIKLLYKSEQSEENYLEEVEVQQNSSVHVSNNEQQPLLNCGEKHDKSQAADLIKDISITKGGFTRSNKNQSPMNKPNAIAAEQEACQMGEKGGNSREDNSDIAPLAEGKSQAADLIEDISVPKGGYTKSKKNQSPMSEPNSIAAEQEACQMGEKEGNSSADNSNIAPLAEDTPRILPCEQDTTTLVHRTGGRGTSEGMVAPLRFTSAPSDKEQDQCLRKLGKRKEPEGHVDKAYRMIMGVDTDGTIPSPSVPMTPHDSKGLDECGDEASETSIHLVENMLYSHDAARKPRILVEKSRARKSRKMRTLNEIINSEGLKNDVKKHISSESTGASGNASVETLDASRQKDEHPNYGCHLVQNTEAGEIERKKRKEAVPIDGEGTLLIDWLKTVPKKAALHKGEADSKRINNVAFASRFATMKGLDLNLEYSGSGEFKRELIAEKKCNMMPEVEVVKPSSIPQEDSTVQKGHITREDLLRKNSRGKRAGIFISDKELETRDDSHKKVSSTNKNKRPLVEDGTSTQRCFKEQSVPKGHREGKKKQRIMPISEPEPVDEFAMEIVKVLSNMNAENDKAHMSKLSETPVGIKDDNGLGRKSGDHGSKVLDAGPANRCLSQEEPQCSYTGNDASSPVRNNGDDGCRSRASHSSSGSKQCYQFDLNQEASACASADLQEPSPFVGLSVSGAQLSIVDSNINYSPRHLSTEEVKMAALCSNTINQTVASHNVLKNSIDGSRGMLYGYQPRINAQKVCSGFNSDSICPGVNQQADAPEADYQTSAKLSKDNAESSIYKGPFAAKSFAEPGNGYCSDLMRPVNVLNNGTVFGNGYHTSMMQPVNIPNNGTDSAVNLLGLMQHSPGSAEPNHSSAHNAYMEYIQAIRSVGCHFLRSLVAEPMMLPGSSSNCKLDKQPGDLCRPLRPHPRNILGPLLQMEVNNTSDDVAPTLGFGSRNPSILTFQNTGFITRESNALTSEKGKAKASQLVPVTNIQPSTSLYGAFEKVGSSLVSHATPGCSLSSDGIGQVVTGSRDRTFQPLISTSKMEECLLNRNPADFAAPDEDSEYMIGYEQRNTKDLLQTGTLLSQTHLLGKKGQKMRKLKDLTRSRTSNKPSLSRFCPQKAK